MDQQTAAPDGLIIGIDIGGTFTDVCAIFPDGRLWSTKVSSTPPAFEDGFLNGIAELARELELEPPELLGRVSRIAHGTTVATNSLLTRQGEPDHAWGRAHRGRHG
jgi:N-methylhydantoinase A